jgi:uncharacterized membrane protein YozB (DUF420 family)
MQSKSRFVLWGAIGLLVVAVPLGLYALLCAWWRIHPGQSWLRY